MSNEHTVIIYDEFSVFDEDMVPSLDEMKEEHRTQCEHWMRDALAVLIHDRDCLYESVSCANGLVPEREDREELARADALIDRGRALIGEH